MFLFMKTLASPLTPFLRSDALGALLAEVYGHPEEEFSLTELGRLTGQSTPSVHREVDRLVDAEVLLDRRQGRNRLVRANPDHALFEPMRQVIETSYGPMPVVRELFSDVQGAEKLMIYGSWAARRAGESGSFPRDIDVLVIGDASRRELARRAEQAGERLGLPVNVTRVPREDWEAPTPSPFIETIRSRPLVEISEEVHGG